MAVMSLCSPRNSIKAPESVFAFPVYDQVNDVKTSSVLFKYMEFACHCSIVKADDEILEATRMSSVFCQPMVSYRNVV